MARTTSSASSTSHRRKAEKSEEKNGLSPVLGREGSSLVIQAVDALRRVILATASSDVFLGSEDDLIASLGVSRPTFRQAARLLKHENLLTIRRGVGGGFFSQLPSSEAVTRMAAIYLSSQGTTLRHLNDAMGPLQNEAAALLAANPDRSVRAKLGEFLAYIRSDSAPEGFKVPVRRLLAFEERLGELAGNPAILLVMKVMRDLARDPRHRNLKLPTDHVAVHENFQTNLVTAVLDGDAEMAVLFSKRHNAAVQSWIADELLKPL